MCGPFTDLEGVTGRDTNVGPGGGRMWLPAFHNSIAASQDWQPLNLTPGTLGLPIDLSTCALYQSVHWILRFVPQKNTPAVVYAFIAFFLALPHHIIWMSIISGGEHGDNIRLGFHHQVFHNGGEGHLCLCLRRQHGIVVSLWLGLNLRFNLPFCTCTTQRRCSLPLFNITVQYQHLA